MKPTAFNAERKTKLEFDRCEFCLDWTRTHHWRYWHGDGYMRRCLRCGREELAPEIERRALSKGWQATVLKGSADMMLGVEAI